MSSIAPTLQLFFTERMVRQLQASPRTVVSYRDACRLLLRFAAGRTGKAPSALGWQDVDAGVIFAFLDHLEADRHSGRAPSRYPQGARQRPLPLTPVQETDTPRPEAIRALCHSSTPTLTSR